MERRILSYRAMTALTILSFGLSCKQPKKDSGGGAADPCAPVASNASVITPSRLSLLGTVGYVEHIQPFISVNCGSSCHGPNSGGVPDLSTYEKLKLVAPSALADMQLTSASQNSPGRHKMPPPQTGKVVSATDVSNFATWIQDGMPATATGSLTPVPNTFPTQPGYLPGGTTQVAYDNRMKVIIDQYCVTCHRLGGTAQPSMTSALEVAPIGARMVARVKAGTMPPMTSQQLTAEAKQAFLDWELGGYLQTSTASTASTFPTVATTPIGGSVGTGSTTGYPPSRTVNPNCITPVPGLAPSPSPIYPTAPRF